MYKASIRITLRSSILDPQGKAVHHALGSLGYAAVERVRMGKFAELWIDADTEAEATRVAEEACEKLLANPVMEDFEVAVAAVAETAA